MAIKKVDKFIHVEPGAEVMREWAAFRERVGIKQPELVGYALRDFIAKYKNAKGPEAFYQERFGVKG
jgi:hypothetical protein